MFPLRLLRLFLIACLIGGAVFVSYKVYIKYLYQSQHHISSIAPSENTPFQTEIQLIHPAYQLKPLKKRSTALEKGLIARSQKRWHVVDQEHLLGELQLEEILLKNTGDYYYFLRYKPEMTNNDPLQLQIHWGAPSSLVKERHITYPPVPQGSPYTIDNSKWSDESILGSEGGLPIHSLHLNGEDFSSFFSRVDAYEPLGNGVRKVDHEATVPLRYRSTQEGKNIILSLPHHKGWEMEQWGIVGKPDMFDWKDEKQKKLKLIANLDYLRKWTQGGVQYIPDPSYVPYHEWAFWVVPAQHVGNKLLLYGNDRFSKNLALLSLESALQTQGEAGYWKSTPQSSWLLKDYAIDAGFYDTRFNTDAALFLLEGYRRFQDEEYLDSAKRYGDFLIQYATTHHGKTRNGGYLVYDYSQQGHSGKVVRTHSSLNHLLAEMNFLYDLYRETKETKYFDVAEKMKQAVKDTHLGWVKQENGDLWYAYMPDDTFGMQDYKHLTLKDLKTSQELFQQLFGQEDADFQYLIEVKESYLKKNQLPLLDWEGLLFPKKK